MCGAARTRFRSVAWGERMFRAARARTGLAVAVLVLAIAGLTALAAGGALTRIDQYGLDHLMPALNPDRAQAQESHGYRGYFLPFGLNTSWWVKLLDTWCYPCSVVISFLIVALACLVLHRRGRTVLGLAWAGAWVAGNAIEVIGKGVLARPDLFGTDDAGLRIHVSVFDQSFPSGHAIRCVLVAGALLLLLQRPSRAVLVWAVLVFPALVLSAAHVITDVVGGALIGMLVALLALAVADRLDARSWPLWTR